MLTLCIPQAEVAVSRWAANVLYVGGVPDIPRPTPATVQLDVEGISVALRDWFLLCEADEIRRVIWQQTLIILHVADLGKPDGRLCLDCRDYYAAAVLACLPTAHYGAELEQLPPFGP